ncbi:MAG TPA: Holliday junction branch migration protein RuvA [Anaerolineales bacterium]|nr:Holliday junction branch migration protein RuvA [Anaerolineales bacterium]
MIASLAGEVLEVNADNAVVMVGGVGLQVYVPAPVRDHIRAGERIFLHTYLVVREDALTLYGFETKEGRQLFALLLGVNGVGPRLALAVLSTLNPESIRRAVFHEQDELFNRVPGVGKRTAQKILMYLQDRLPVEVGLQPVTLTSDVDGELLSALTTLGYSVVEAQAAIQAIPRDAPQDEETRLRLALQYFTKP